MKVVIDQAKLERRGRASHAASLGGLLMILASVALSLWRQDLAIVVVLMLVVGFATSSTGIYFANRWVKKPRPEEILDRALKGLDDRHRIYHYLDKGPEHTLLTPYGVVILETRAGEGLYEYVDGKWHQRITLGRALRFFVEEPLGDPVTDARNTASRWASALEGKLGAAGVPVMPLVVFTHPAAEVHCKNPPIPVCQPKQLRGEMAKHHRPLPRQVYDQVQALLDSGGPFQ